MPKDGSGGGAGDRRQRGDQVRSQQLRRAETADSRCTPIGTDDMQSKRARRQNRGELSITGSGGLTRYLCGGEGMRGLRAGAALVLKYRREKLKPAQVRRERCFLVVKVPALSLLRSRSELGNSGYGGQSVWDEPRSCIRAGEYDMAASLGYCAELCVLSLP